MEIVTIVMQCYLQTIKIRSNAFLFTIVLLICTTFGTETTLAGTVQTCNPPTATKRFVATIDIYTIDEYAKPSPDPIMSTQFASDGSPFNIAEVYVTQGQYHLVLLNGITGETGVIRFNPETGCFDLVQETNVGSGTWRSVQVIRQDNQTRLFLYNTRDNGKYREMLIDDLGVIIDGSEIDHYSPALKNKNLFSTFAQSGRRLFALSTWNGSTAVMQLTPDQGSLTEDSDYLGWSHLDHMKRDGQVFRMMYKEAGFPYSPAEDDGAAGTLEIFSVAPDGTTGPTVYHAIYGHGWSQAQFVRLSPTRSGVLFYKRGLLGAPGIIGAIRFQGLTPTPFVELLPTFPFEENYHQIRDFRIADQTYVMAVRFSDDLDEDRYITAGKAAKIASCVAKQLENRAAGFQLSMLQAGREVMQYTSGYSQIDPATEMTDRSRIDAGSVGKMFTTITALKMSEQPQYDINLNFPIGYQVDPDKYPPFDMDQWTLIRTPLDLMAQATGWKRESDGSEPFACDPVGDLLTVDCTPFFSTEPPLAEDCKGTGDQLHCLYNYHNSHFGALRQVVEHHADISTTKEIDTLTRDLWLGKLFEKEGPTCRRSETSKYINVCSPLIHDQCISFGEQSYTQNSSTHYSKDGWSKSCGAGGWNASSKDLVEILEMLGAEKVLDTDNTELLYRTDLKDAGNNGVAIGWGPPYSARNGGDMVLGKGGVSGASSYVTNLEAWGQAALIINTVKGSPLATSVLQDAVWAAMSLTDCNPMQTFVIKDEDGAGTTSEISIDKLGIHNFATAMRDSDGNLKLSTWSHDSDDIERDDTLQDEAATYISALGLSASELVTAFRDANGSLKVKYYHVSNQNIIKLESTIEDEEVFDTDVVKLKVAASTFAVVMRNANSQLQINTYQYSAGFSGIKLLSSFISQDVADIQSVSATSDPANPGRIVAAVQTGDNNGRVLAFDVDSEGKIEPLAVSHSNIQLPGKDIKITSAVYTTFNDLVYFITASRSPDDNLVVASWKVKYNEDTDTYKIKLKQSYDKGEIKSISNSLRSDDDRYVYIPVIDSNDKTKVYTYTIDQEGFLSSKTTISENQGTALDFMTMFSYQVMAILQLNGDLRVANWKKLNGGF